MISKKSNKMKFKKLLLMLPTTILAGTGVANLVACSCGDKPEVATYWNENVEKALGFKNEDGSSNVTIDLQYLSDKDKVEEIVKLNNGSGAILKNGQTAKSLFEGHTNSQKVSAFIENVLGVKKTNGVFKANELDNFLISDVKVEGSFYSISNVGILAHQPRNTKISFTFKTKAGKKVTSTITVAMLNQTNLATSNVVSYETFNDGPEFSVHGSVLQKLLKHDYDKLNSYSNKKVSDINFKVLVKDGWKIADVFADHKQQLAVMNFLGLKESDISATISIRTLITSKESLGPYLEKGDNDNLTIGDILRIDFYLKETYMFGYANISLS